MIWWKEIALDTTKKQPGTLMCPVIWFLMANSFYVRLIFLIICVIIMKI